jgi:ABC-2 type transport system permease protein
MEYRGDFFISMLSSLFPITIQFFMWTGIYGSSGSASMFGYTFVQMITYSIMASIVARLIRTGFEYEINDDIKNGGLNKYIVRPVGYFPYKLSCFIGQKLVHFAFCSILFITAVVVLTVFFGYDPNPYNLIGFIAALVLAFILNFIIFYCVSMIAFWLSEIGFFFEAVRIVIIAFSGGIFPLDVFDSGFLAVLNYLPFKYTVNFPVNVFNGKLTGTGLYTGFILQLFWILTLALLSRLLWSAGSKKYVAVGG